MREDLVFDNGCPSEEQRSGTAVYVDGGEGPSIVTLDHVTIAGHNCPFAAPAGAAIQVENLSKLTVKDSIIWGNSREFQTLDKGSYTVENTVTTVSGKGNRSADPHVRRSRQGRLPLSSLAAARSGRLRTRPTLAPTPGDFRVRCRPLVRGASRSDAVHD